MPQPEFNVIQARRDGQPVLIVIDCALQPESDAATYPWLLIVTIPMRGANSAGLCNQTESSRLDEVEDTLLSVLEERDYRYAGHITGNARREILLYVADHEDVTAKLNKALAQTGEPRIEVVSKHDPMWDHYRQFRSGA